MTIYFSDASQTTAESLVGNDHLSDRFFYLENFKDISLLTGCNFGPNTNIIEYCHHNGIPGCHCPPGYTGQHCQIGTILY